MDNLPAHKVAGIREAIEAGTMYLLKLAHPCIEISVGVMSRLVDGWARRFAGGGFPLQTSVSLSRFVLGVGATVVYLSPYSPDFSPIENCWSKVKEFLRARAARTYAELDQAITDALAAVTTKDIIGWFTHCCCYVPSN